MHPKLIVEHVIATCKFEGRPPELKWEVVQHAVQNLGEMVRKGK